MKKREPTILIVEDDPNDQFMLTRWFKKTGVTTPMHVVNNGLEAIAYMMGEGEYANREAYCYPTFYHDRSENARSRRFRGLEFLKKNPQWAVIPTIVFSASTDLDDIKKAYMLGASSYHVKPTAPEALLHQLQVLHAYWITCEVPQVDSTGKQLHTNSRGKLGERFPQDDASAPQPKL